MPTNLYGPGDNDDLNTSHVLLALTRKALTAKNENQPSMTVWGTGTPRREFLYSDDLAGTSIDLKSSSFQRRLESSPSYFQALGRTGWPDMASPSQLSMETPFGALGRRG